MCKLYLPRKTGRKYCYKIYWMINNSLFTIYTLHKHIIGRRYKAVNVKMGRKVSRFLIAHVSSAGYRHIYDSDQVGFMGFASKQIAEKERIPNDYVVVKCLMKGARIDGFNREVDCQYITPLKIIKEDY